MNNFKTGDLVTLINNNAGFSYISLGKIYKVLSYDNSTGCVGLIDDEDDNAYYTDCHFTLAKINENKVCQTCGQTIPTSTTPTAPPTPSVKKGDRVMFEGGVYRVLTDVDSSNKVDILMEDGDEYVEVSDLTITTDKLTVIYADEYKPTNGDWIDKGDILILNDASKLNSLTEGNEYVVSMIDIANETVLVVNDNKIAKWYRINRFNV